MEKIKGCRQFDLNINGEIIMVTGKYPDMIIPHDKHALAKHLIKLHANNCIMLLMQPKDELDWWIVGKKVQNTLFSSANALFSPHHFEDAPHHLSFTHNTGVVPTEKLDEIFSNLSMDIEAILNYLICMEFCKRIDKDILHLIPCHEKDLGSSKSEFFFFPGLIKKEKDENIYQTEKDEKDDIVLHSGWLMTSKSNFGLRFLHSLLLCLAFKFPHSTSDSSYSRKVCLWKNGLYWCTRSQVEILVEIRHDKEVYVLCRCNSVSANDFAKCRSEVIQEIRDIKEKIILGGDDFNESTEYCLYPPPQTYGSLQNCKKIPLSDLVKCFKEEPNHRSHFIDENIKPTRLCEILGRDPYIDLKPSVLKLKSDELVTISLLPEVVTKLLELKTVAESIESGESISFLDLCRELDKYSILKGRDLARVTS